MTGVGLFLMLSSFLYYLIRSRSSYSGQSHMPVMRVATTLVVMLSWLGGMALLLLFAPINADRAVMATRFHSYLLSFTCLFVLIVFIAIKGAFERSQTNAVDNRQMDQSIAEALRRFGAPASVPASSGMLGGSSQAQSRPYTAQRRRAGVRDSAAVPSHGITLSYAELRNLALDAKVCQEGDHATSCMATLTLIFHPMRCRSLASASFRRPQTCVSDLQHRPYCPLRQSLYLQPPLWLRFCVHFTTFFALAPASALQ